MGFLIYVYENSFKKLMVRPQACKLKLYKYVGGILWFRRKVIVGSFLIPSPEGVILIPRESKGFSRVYINLEGLDIPNNHRYVFKNHGIT